MNRTYDELTLALRDRSLTAARAVLNARVPQRFSAVYRFSGGRLINVAFVDKLAEPLPEHPLSVPVRSRLPGGFMLMDPLAGQGLPCLHFVWRST